MIVGEPLKSRIERFLQDFSKPYKKVENVSMEKRIYVEKGELDRVHLADNLADALIAVGDAKQLAKSEALRVLRPQGKAFVGDEVWEKPFPEGVDDWSHPYHGPDNNTQSNDQVALAPYLTQFFAEPRYAPAIQVAVASAGRIFKAFGNVVGNRFPFPIRIWGQVDFVSLFGRRFQLFDNAAFTLNQLIVNFETILGINADFGFGQINNMTYRRQDLVVLTNEATQSLGLCRRLDDNQILCHLAACVCALLAC